MMQGHLFLSKAGHKKHLLLESFLNLLANYMPERYEQIYLICPLELIRKVYIFITFSHYGLFMKYYWKRWGASGF